MSTIKDLKWAADYTQKCLVSLIENIHSDFEVPLTVHRNIHDSLYFSIHTQTPITSCLANRIRYSTCSVKRIDIATSSLVLCIPEYFFVASHVQPTIEETITNPMNLKDLSIQFINTDESMLVIGSTRIDKSPSLREVIVSTRIGLGVSYKLKEKIQSHCRQKCNKFIRCILRPEKCNLALIMRTLK